MDYKKLRKHIVSKLLSITTAWNTRTSSYAVKPPNLTEQQQVVWQMLTTNSTLGNLSEMQSRAFRNMAEEVLGAKIPDTKNRNLEDFDPYICLTSQSTDMGIVSSGKVIMKKLSGPWVGPTGRTVNKNSIPSQWLRMPTQEEIEDLVNGIPDESLILPFSGIFKFKKTKEITEALVTLVTDASTRTFESKPSCTLEGKELEMYKISGDLSDNYRKLIFLSTDMVYDNAKQSAVVDYLEASFTPNPMTCVICPSFKDGVVLVNKQMVLCSRGAEMIDPLEWEHVTPASPEQIAKLAGELPINLVFGYLPVEMQSALAEEVKLE